MSETVAATASKNSPPRPTRRVSYHRTASASSLEAGSLERANRLTAVGGRWQRSPTIQRAPEREPRLMDVGPLRRSCYALVGLLGSFAQQLSNLALKGVLVDHPDVRVRNPAAPV